MKNRETKCHSGLDPESRGLVVGILKKVGILKRGVLNQVQDDSGVKDDRIYKKNNQITKKAEVVLPLYFGWEIVIRRIKDWEKHIVGPFKKYWQYMTAVIILITIVSITILLNQHNTTSAATFYFTQGDFNTADTADNANHNDDQNNWTKYYTKDGKISASSTIAMNSATTTYSEETYADFSAGTISSTKSLPYQSATNGQVRLATSSADSFDGKVLWPQVYTAPNHGNATDLDGDGDMDIFSTAYYAHDVVWYENDGSENFTKRTVDDNFLNARDGYVIDLDDDGDYDFVVNSVGSDDVVWYENDGSESFTKHDIDISIDNPQDLDVADLDDDGDKDIVAVSKNGHYINWYENDGSENFTEHVVVDWTADGVLPNGVLSKIADIDGDGDKDIYSITNDRHGVWWQKC